MTVPPPGASHDGAPHDGATPPPAPDAGPAGASVPPGWPPSGWPTKGRRGTSSAPAAGWPGAAAPGSAPAASAPAASAPGAAGIAPAGTVPDTVPAGWPPSGWPGRSPSGHPAQRTQPDWSPGRFHRGDLAVVLVYAALMLVPWGLPLLLPTVLGLVPSDPSAFTVRDAFTVNIVNYTVLVILVLAVAWRPLVESLRVFRTGTWWKILLLPATWLTCIVVNVILLTLIGEAQTSANQAALEEMTTQAPPVLMILMTVVGAPLVEEYLFRHLLIGKLSRWLNVWVCAAVSAIAFTLLHFLGTGGNFKLVEVIPYLTLAIAISVSYILLGRSFGYAVLLHMVNNGIAIAMLYLVAPLIPEVPEPTTPAVALVSGLAALLA